MKTRHFIFLMTVLFVACTFFSCEKDEEETVPEFFLEAEDPIDPEVYEIYSYVIDEMFNGGQVVILQKTKNSYSGEGEWVKSHFTYNYPDFDTTLVQTHAIRNETRLNFGEKFECEQKDIVLITSDELDYLFDTNEINQGWINFQEKYKNAFGYVQFSMVAINEEQTQAIFELDHIFGSLGATWNVVYLEKIDGNWTLKEVYLTAIS